jgi:arsenate reductase
MVLNLLQHCGIPVSDLRSKSWDEFVGPAAPQLDFVFTVCDRAAGEVCPVWPGQPVTGHWGVPDPAVIRDDERKKERSIAEAFRILERRIDLFMCLPIGSLDRMSLRERVREIGQR